MSDTANKLVIDQVKPDMVGVIGKHVMPLLEKACAYSNGRFDTSSALERCAGMNQRDIWQLWVVFDPEHATHETFGDHVKAVACTSLNKYPTDELVAEVILIGGKGPSEEWLPYFETLNAWARHNGASRIQYIGRRGWQRSMRALGVDWKPIATMYECELEVPDGDK